MFTLKPGMWHSPVWHPPKNEPQGLLRARNKILEVLGNVILLCSKLLIAILALGCSLPRDRMTTSSLRWI
jgi:hypothetical protein